MTPPAMCPECERSVAATYLREGAAAAVLIHGKGPCPHVVKVLGFTLVPDPKCPGDVFWLYHPHPLVAAAYGERVP